MSLFDSLRNIKFFANKTDNVKPDPTPEKQLFSKDDYAPEGKLWQDQGLSMEECRKLAYSVPLFYKANHKKNMDVFRGLPELSPTTNKDKPSQLDVQIYDSFNARTNIQTKLYEMGISAYTYGTGFGLITYMNDTDDQDLTKPPKKVFNSKLQRNVFPEPRKLTVMNSEKIFDTKYLDEQQKSRRLRHFVYKENNRDMLIHPDRLLILRYDFLPFSVFGISKTHILRHILDSFVDIDVSAGETLKWSSHGLVIWKKNNMKIKERKFMLDTLKTHPNAYAIDESQDIKVEKPNAIDPKPFYDFLAMEIASAFVMPMHILTGIEVGKTTGAEVGYGDYRKDISDIQYLKINPSLKELYTRLFESHGREFSYNLIWPEAYVDEMSQANIMFKRAAVVERLWKSGTADREERRRVMNDGFSFLDPTLESSEEPPQKKETPGKPVNELEAQEHRLEEARRVHLARIKELVEENK